MKRAKRNMLDPGIDRDLLTKARSIWSERNLSLVGEKSMRIHIDFSEQKLRTKRPIGIIFKGHRLDPFDL